VMGLSRSVHGFLAVDHRKHGATAACPPPSCERTLPRRTAEAHQWHGAVMHGGDPAPRGVPGSTSLSNCGGAGLTGCSIITAAAPASPACATHSCSRYLQLVLPVHAAA